MRGFWQRFKNNTPSNNSTDSPSQSFFQKILSAFRSQKVSTNKSASEDVQTAPLSEAQLLGVSKAPTRYQPVQVGVGSSQSVGKVRDHNEDTLFTFHSILADGGEDLPFGLFIVADGMGGHQHGEVASGTAVRVVADVILNRLYIPLLSLSSDKRNEPIQELMESAIREAQYAVTRQAPGGGTTLTAALMLGD